MAKTKGRRVGNPAARAQATEEPIVREARRHLAELDAKPRSYELTYYALEPSDLSDDLDVPIDGNLHAHDGMYGRTLHLDESRRRATIAEASQGFTNPILGVLRNFEDVDAPVDHATVVLGADLQSGMLLNPLRVIQIEHHIEALHFAALIGMSTRDGEWAPDDEGEIAEIATDWQLRVEAESVIVAGRIMARRGQ
ncbi:hypothetical protein M3666_12070 [Curtobacterium sp. ODYSSEY 48 V2]|uniref:hypothetical protein n=1 Tax=Curtobacterium sp. ODYSSEY 48 V2 TaxID=2939561 RepID=UPI00203CB6C2|nr:hypothetical protein [Curtobacterium sp. ODYSSEY 48 V2]MCM3505850.1 hypothetical protein [Curtobacterium sp. ODYSSEY 48 V2]